MLRLTPTATLTARMMLEILPLPTFASIPAPFPTLQGQEAMAGNLPRQQAERLREILTALGPAFVKIGQVGAVEKGLLCRLWGGLAAQCSSDPGARALWLLH